MTAMEGFHIFINLLMGTGPILLPPVVAGAGIILSSLVIIIFGVINLICALFVVEVN
jgi:amino acid permease